ncbi:exodeoxyribonuclease V subunit gamma [Synechococcus sp. M16CYN]|uniref:exodeoxyribonuclease V subunit gamma n=1 Tax=Synechococcus sp. M16CYN TaxID=3103139 RepID=UPI00333F88F1
MLKLYRSNRAELLAQLLAQQLIKQKPGPLEVLEVMVNTRPTGSWLGEQVAVANGITSLVRFPYPNSYLRQLVREVLGLPSKENDPWRAKHLIWPVLKTLPELLDQDVALPLQRWLNGRERSKQRLTLSRDRWQLARAIADAFDDYALYRPDVLTEWSASPSFTYQDWQPVFWRLLAGRLHSLPFGLQVREAIGRLRSGTVSNASLPDRLRLFGISALAPVQVELIQALSSVTDVEIYLLTSCPDLWQLCSSRRKLLQKAWLEPMDGTWLEAAPRLEAKLGRMGAEFQQLLEGSGAVELEEHWDKDLFATPVRTATQSNRSATLLEQLQEQLVNPGQSVVLQRLPNDQSVIFQAAPGPWREVQLIRDRILQWLAADSDLAPRDVLIMTPQIDRYAPLLNSVFNDYDATGVHIPWRLTSQSCQSSLGISRVMLNLLELAAGRFTATGLKQFLTHPILQQLQALSSEECVLMTRVLQRSGFRWGLDATERGGDETHSLSWCLDRWLLGLVLPSNEGLAPLNTAPFNWELDPDRLVRWWTFLDRLARMIQQFRRPKTCSAWVDLLRSVLQELFGNGWAWSYELQHWITALEDWRLHTVNCSLELDITLVIEVLNEALSVDSGRFGHCTSSLTISALEPMWAIPYKVIVLMGLDDAAFPRSTKRPGFHLLEQEQRLGDPSESDQDRYVLLESLISARRHLLVSWCSRNERTGENQPPAAPVEQWLLQLQQELSNSSTEGLLLTPAANPLARSNFRVEAPLSCDRRQLEVRRWLDRKRPEPKFALSWPLEWANPTDDSNESTELNDSMVYENLLYWMRQPQMAWLRSRGLHPGETFEAVEDFDPLELNALERYQLLNRNFEQQLAAGGVPDWPAMLTGQGILPAGAGAALEQRELAKRWQALMHQLNILGSCHRDNIVFAGALRPLLFAGETQVVVQAGMLSTAGVMRGWLHHLYLCATTPTPTAVIARSTGIMGAETYLLWDPLSTAEAERQLTSLQRLAQRGMERCWPVPPKSGWQMAWQEQRRPGTGLEWFRSSWQKERWSPALHLCFGAEVDADELLKAPGFREAYSALYGPLLQAQRS